MQISRRKFIGSGILLGIGATLLDAFWVEKFFIEINEYYLGSEKKEPPNIKVVQISDLHLQSLNYQLIKLTKKLNELKPDLILITGDAIDKANNISILNDFLKIIHKQIKKVAILGNWEYWGNVDLIELNKIYSDNNCSLLINETQQYTFKGKTISITGVDDFIGGKADFDASIKHYKSSDHHIILNHCPQYSDYISQKLRGTAVNADFILSGHTHGGQINLFGFIPFLPQGSGNYVKGWYKENSPNLYVSKGIGTSIFPARFGARAEIAVFNLTS